MKHVSSVVVDNAEPESPQELGLGFPVHAETSRDGAVETWLRARLNLVVVGVIGAGFVLRVYAAGRSFLDPDEALHYLILNQKSVFWAYRISLTNAHPPLIYLLLYFWRFLGRSELMLRFPSVLAGTAVCWAAYKWIGTVFGKAAGLIGLILMAFSPVLIALSAEVRSYSLLLFFETTALYLVERALREKSVRKMWQFSVFLYLAILSHYSASFFVLTVGIYTLARIVESRLPRNVIAFWAGGQAGALAIYAFLYVTHLSKLKNAVTTWAMGFDKILGRPDRGNLFSFARERTTDIFSYLFLNQYLAQALLLLWIVAIVLLLVRESVFRREIARARHSGILLLLPFIVVIGAGIAGFYPYVGSRHTVFLAPFVIAALSFLLATIYGKKLWAAIVIAALFVTASNTSGKMPESYITKENQSRTLMVAAVNYMQQTIPPNDLILTDYESALILVYYFCGPKVILPTGTFNLPASRVKCNGHTIASFQTWNMDAAFLVSNFGKIAKAQRIGPGDRVWVIESGWSAALGQQLRSTSPEFRCLNQKTFGANISIIPFTVGPDFSPVSTVSSCPESASNSST